MYEKGLTKVHQNDQQKIDFFSSEWIFSEFSYFICHFLILQYLQSK